MVSKKVGNDSVEITPQTIKARFWIHISSNGDGSASALFFDSEEAAEQYASHDSERFTDDIYKASLEFNLNGELVTPNPSHDDFHYNAEKDLSFLDKDGGFSLIGGGGGKNVMDDLAKAINTLVNKKK